VLLAGMAALIGCFIGLTGRRPFAPLGRIFGLIYVSVLDTQVLVGILLSCASPLVHAFWANPGVGMKNDDLRFFAIEHTVIMLLALVLAHVGAVKSRKSKDAAKAYSVALTWYALSLVVILLGIPWWRPLLRL
jgi:cytochrome c biogenesis factor